MGGKDNEYGTKRVAELFGNYIRLKKSVRTLSLNELKESETYRTLLQIEYRLRSFTFTGEELLEMANFIDVIVNADDIRASSVYKEMLKEQQEEHSQLVNDFTALNERHSKLKSKLEEALRPFSSLLELIKK